MYQKIFNKLDINSSGNLSISEVAMGLIEYGYEVTLQQIEEIFTLMDSSKNGLVSL
jgi:Ca2+-binding EF-hand superfamily protein